MESVHYSEDCRRVYGTRVVIYWYTGQPGHGKSLHAIERAMDFVKSGRVVYACNVKDLNYEKTGMLPMTPEQFIDWPNSLPDGSVVLVDECYQHGMLNKLPPGSKLPKHVDELARHRHRGLDFIFVSQSPSRQCHEFIVDLIEEQIHVRRMFGTKFVELRKFDRHERNPEKARPISVTRQTLNRKSKGLYTSTVLDTTEKRVPWYYYALAAAIVVVPIYAWWIIGKVGHKLAHDDGEQTAQYAAQPGANGARSATVATGVAAQQSALRSTDYVAWMRPRVPSQPWTAPAYDGLTVPHDPPRVFCMSSGRMHGKQWVSESCTCLTDQGTRYRMDHMLCARIAQDGQYEPFLTRAVDAIQGNTGQQQFRQLSERRAIGSDQEFGSHASYGNDGLGAY